MRLQRYNQFINEGLISKGLELLNYKTVKENDKIAQKYLKMVYDNYNNHKNLMAVKISFNKGYTNFWYKISEDPYTQSGTSGGEYPDYIEVNLTSINEMGWSSDLTRARIEVEKNGKNLIGRDMNTNKTIESESGIDRDVYDYLNISQSQVDKMIQFFKSEYIKKYPEMIDFKAFNYMRILEIDKKLTNKLKNRYESQKKKHEEDREIMEQKFGEFIDERAEFDHEEIKDYFIDLIDYVNENTIIKDAPSIGISTIIDDKFVSFIKRFNNTNSIFYKGLFYYHKMDRIEGVKPNKIYYYLDFNIPIFSGDEEDEDVSGGSINYEKIEKFVQKEYGLFKESGKSTNSTFKLIDIGCDNELFKSFFKNVQFAILLEQKMN